MKNKIFISLVLAIVLIFLLIPSSFLGAKPANILQNGDFETGSFVPGWSPSFATVFYDNTYGGTFSYVASLKVIPGINNVSVINQFIDNYYSSNLNLSFSYWNVFSSGESSVEINFIDSSTNLSNARLATGNLPYNSSWESRSYNILQWWDNEHPNTSFPYFDRILVSAKQFGNVFGDLWVDNFYLGQVQASNPSSDTIKPDWVRTMPMTCWNVWINEDNNFQFSFIYPYKNNNWVKIYDMGVNLVYESDLPYKNPNLIVDLPDGTYTVKTFHNDMSIPIQEFVIGKP